MVGSEVTPDGRTTGASALVALILEKRAELAQAEARRRPARDDIMRQSIFLGGLEKAAKLTLGPDDLAILFTDKP